MKIKFTVGKSTKYLLSIEWKSLYKYQALLLCMNSGDLIEYCDSTPTKCILRAKHVLDLQGFTISHVDSVVDYLHPIDEVLDAVIQFAKSSETERDTESA